MTGRSSTRALAAAILGLVLLAVPGAWAGYEGPGQTGLVPLGDGGQLATTLPELGAGLTHVSLAGVPRDVCRIDIAPLGADEIGLAWAPGNDTAHVYAGLGTRDAQFQVKAHWTWDVKDECTIEHDENGTTYHDPRGRPFVEVFFPERRPFFTPVTGEWSRVEVPVRNNGTLPEIVDLTLDLQRAHWKIENSTPTAAVHLGPEETYVFGFDLLVPVSEPARLNLLVVRMEARSSGMQDRVTLFLDLQKGEAQPEAPAAAAPDTTLPPWEPVEEASLPPFAVLFVLLVMPLWLRWRARRGTSFRARR